jgi:uncharacterized membrane protein
MATTYSESTYRQSYIGIWALGAVAFAGLIVAGLPLVGVATFVAAAVGAVGLQQTYGGVLFDERDQTTLREAGANTIAVLGMTSAVVFPTFTALHALGLYTWPAWLTPIAWIVTALFGVWLVMLLLARR